MIEMIEDVGQRGREHAGLRQFASQKLLHLLIPRLPCCIASAVREDVAADVKILAIVLAVGSEEETVG
jgi:hypothetical protein